MKHKINLKLLNLKSSNIYYENKYQNLYSIHHFNCQQTCRTLHPITFNNSTLDSKRVSDQFFDINFKMNITSNKYLNNGTYIFPQLEIPVAFHVIYPNGKENDAIYNIPDDILNKQLDVLNGVSDNDPGFSKSLSGYKTNGNTKSGLHFYNYHSENKAYSRTENNMWFYKTETYESTLKSELCVNVDYVINVYYADAQGFLGWSYFPNDFSENDHMHGAVINHRAILGGSLPRYKYGKTLLHELGHYFGLFHTFQGGCFGYDGCDDTPPQSNGNNVYECGSQNSCPDFEGDDPHNNYMNYVDDICMNRFTDNQILRIWTFLETYKPQFILKNKVETNSTKLSNLNISFYTGWNLFSLPNSDTYDFNLSEFVNDIYGDIYEFNRQSIIAENLVKGKTYWINFNKDIQITIPIITDNNIKLTLNKGWNLIGGLNGSYKLDDSILVYEFDNKKKIFSKNLNTLEPGLGYWIKSFI